MKSRFCVASMCLASLLLAAGCNDVHPSIRYKDGLNDYQTGHLTEAIGNFREAYKGQPGDANTCYWLGRCYLDLSRKAAANDNTVTAMGYADRATFYFDAAIKIVPSYLLAIEGKAEAQRLKGDYEKATEIARSDTRHLTPTSKTLLARARAYEAGGDMDRALVTYKEAAVAEPYNAEALEGYGRALLVAGERDHAVEYLQKSYSIKPTVAVYATLHELGASPEVAPNGGLKPVPLPKDLPRPQAAR